MVLGAVLIRTSSRSPCTAESWTHFRGSLCVLAYEGSLACAIRGWASAIASSPLVDLCSATLTPILRPCLREPKAGLEGNACTSSCTEDAASPVVDSLASRECLV